MTEQKKKIYTIPKSFLYGKHPYYQTLFMWLLTHSDNKTGECWPSITMLVNETGMCKNSVLKFLAELETDGAIIKTPGGKMGNSDNSQYVVIIPEKIDPKTRPKSGRGGARHAPVRGAPYARGGAYYGPGGVHTMDSPYIYRTNPVELTYRTKDKESDFLQNENSVFAGVAGDVKLPPLTALKKEKSSAKKERKEELFGRFLGWFPEHRQEKTTKAKRMFMAMNYDACIMAISKVQLLSQTIWSQKIIKGDGEYIPYPATWLKDCQDDPVKQVVAATTALNITPLERCLEITRKPIADITAEEILFFVEHAGWPAISDKLKGDENTKQRLYKIIVDKSLDPLFEGEYFRQCRNEIKDQLDPIEAAAFKKHVYGWLMENGLTYATMPQDKKVFYEERMKSLNAPPETWYTP